MGGWLRTLQSEALVTAGDMQFDQNSFKTSQNLKLEITLLTRDSSLLEIALVLVKNHLLFMLPQL